MSKCTDFFLLLGGHTTEALCLLQKLNTEKFRPVTFVLAETDTTSSVRVLDSWKGAAEDVSAYLHVSVDWYLRSIFLLAFAD
jgi:hypothetical protein